ncbi:MAG: hypothetical protein EA392_03800 [Cryomorphaceae bacterium]|nr:MAG: hypothetical protein EA392_03800 [Cryomorphaceae bacterium]
MMVFSTKIRFSNPCNPEVILDPGAIGRVWGQYRLTVHSSGIAYFSTFANAEEDGLFQFHISSGEWTKLRGHCVLNRPTRLDVSSDGNSLIVSQSFAYFRLAPEGNKPAGFYDNRKLVHFDLNTHEQTLLDLPEQCSDGVDNPHLVLVCKPELGRIKDMQSKITL